ncbi:hypothetical protein D3C81_1442490 [compost metagenome]
MSLTLTPLGRVFSAAITTVLVVSLLYRVPLAPSGLAGSGLAMKPLGRLKVNLSPSIETLWAGASLEVALAACAFKAPRPVAAASSRTRAFLLNNDIGISRDGRAVGRDHPMELVMHSSVLYPAVILGGHHPGPMT